MDDREQAYRNLARTLMGHTEVQQQHADPADDPRGPIIPGQEQTPDTSNKPSPEQLTADRLFNTGTIRGR